jgi:hypothetical protein
MMKDSRHLPEDRRGPFISPKVSKTLGAKFRWKRTDATQTTHP